MNDDVVSALGLVLVLVLLCVPVTATAGAATSSAGAATPVAAANETSADGNETPRHQNPDEYTDDGDLDGIESWLSDRLASQLAESTRTLSQGEYDRARTLVGEEYQDRLGQYIDVAGDTESGGADGDDENTTDTEAAFEDAAENQQTFANATEEYRTTKAAYETARQEGDDERARELARELEAIAANVDAAGADLVTAYGVITFETDSDLSDSAAAINETRTEIQDEQAIVREEQFVQTELSLDAANDSVSFLDPLVVSGEIRTADGTAIDAETVRLLVDGDPIDVEMTVNGSIDFTYRPTSQPLSAETMTIEYVPAAQSPYLGSETALNVSLEQVEPTITNLESTETAAYGDTLAIEGDVTVADVPVDGVGLDVSLGGEVLGELTVTDGTVSGSVPVPAAVRDGNRTLRVALPFDDQALAGVTAETPVTIEETETELTIDTTATSADELEINGTLETTAGEGIGAQPVDVQLDGETVTTVTTDSAGEFAETVAAPSQAATTDVRVSAQYDGTGTSLTASTAETTVSLPGAERSTSSSIPSMAVGATIILITVGGGLVWWWSRQSSADTDQNGAGTGPELGPEPASGATTASAPKLVDAVLSRASTHLSNGRPNAAVRACYTAVRQHYRNEDAAAAALTHWEFYQQYDSVGTADEETDQLREIITEYERATFAPEPVSDSTAARVLEQTSRLCDSGSRSASEIPQHAD